MFEGGEEEGGWVLGGGGEKGRNHLALPIPLDRTGSATVLEMKTYE